MKILLVSLISFFLLNCSTTKEPESTGVWVNKEKIAGKSFSKVFIVVVTADIEARSVLENDLATVATSKGYKAVKSIDVMPPVLSDPKTPTKEEVVNKVKDSGCDAVFVAALLKKDEAVRYVPGKTAYSIAPYYSYAGSYYGYYSYWQPTVSTPSYYQHDKNYFMQSNLYDAASEEIMWSVQSEVFNPSSLSKFSKAYTATLIKLLEKEKVLRK